MEPVFSSQQMKNIDERTIKNYKISGDILMENAARFSYEMIKDIVKEKAIVICGSGNNSGDGYGIARQLFTRGIEVKIYKNNTPKADAAKRNYTICKKLNIPMYPYEKILGLSIRDHLIVDAIFGTGLNKTVQGAYKDIINWINEQKSDNFILSMDIPSGLDANSGKILGTCVKSQMVTTFGAYKRGFFQNDGAKFYKRAFLDNITTPPRFLDSKVNTFDLPVLKEYDLGFNKYDRGKVGIISGSEHYKGAPIISSVGSLKSGAGMFYAIIPESIEVTGFPPEIIEVKFPQKAGYFSPEIGKENIEFLQTLDVIILGPGMGKTKNIEKFIENLLQYYNGKVVIDADAILPAFNFIKNNKPQFEYIIAPHLGEFGKIFPKEDDIFEAMKKFTKKFKMPVLVKGQFAYFADGLGEIYIQPHASAYMSKGGTGDGLAGLLGGLWAQGYSLHDAVNLATYLIGRTAELLEEKNEITNIHITKILDKLDLAIKEL